MPARDDDDLEEVAERCAVELDLGGADELRVLGDDEERRHAQRLPRRRRRRHLPVRLGDDLWRVAVEAAAVRLLDEVLPHLLLEELARRALEACGPCLRASSMEAIRASRARPRAIASAKSGGTQSAGSSRTARSTSSGRRAVISADEAPAEAVADPGRRLGDASRAGPRRAARSSRAPPSPSGRGLAGRGADAEASASRSSASRRKRIPWAQTPCRQTTEAEPGAPGVLVEPQGASLRARPRAAVASRASRRRRRRRRARRSAPARSR